MKPEKMERGEGKIKTTIRLSLIFLTSKPQACVQALPSSIPAIYNSSL
jgi:hypothetical protein